MGIAITGLGRWGQNHVRTFAMLPECRVLKIHDADPAAIARQRAIYPHLEAAESVEHMLGDPQIQAIVIATSAGSHYEVAQAALEAGKDVFVEKPMTLDVEHGKQLCELAERNGRILQVGHLLLFHPAVQFLKGMIDRGELGEIYYIYAQRLNLGTVRSDENSLWSLAPHDISLANYLLGEAPESVTATGGTYLQQGIEDVFFLTLQYPANRLAHIHVSWLDPHKVRRLTIVGSKKMAVFDDTQANEKVRVFDKGVSRPDYENYGELLSVRTGDILIPSLPNTEPLKLQAQHFLRAVRERTQPLADGRQGLEVVRALSQATRQIVA